ncbi:O-antigen ligase family protein [Roseimaritima ulvae]|uniref:O-Antigen ligase n=1 Tax=Roseimaritima ulvae TaxID=980254 RepID=A0A5B9QZY0_9BACT|nr:O-antigen ligase family protein [Roseimaritima ulvae]QEG43005.1 O-Antigen ligase [Roseimaritima ulvae]
MNDLHIPATDVAPSSPLPHRRLRSLPSVWSRTQLLPALSALTLVLAACCNLIDVSGSGLEQVQLSGHVMIKLGISALVAALAVWSLLAVPRVGQILTTPAGLLLLALAAVLMATSAVAIGEVANVSRFAALNFLLSLCFVTACLVCWGADRLAGYVLVGCVAFLLGSWLVYWLVPSVGVYVEHLNPDTAFRRMAGLAHPNGLGRLAMLSVILSLALVRRGHCHRRWLLLIVALGLATAAMAFSRTAILAGAAGLLVLFLDRLPTRRGVLMGLAAMVIGLTGWLAVELTTGSDVLGRLLVATGTKTGHLDELTSATGRTAIWSEALRLSSQRPITGYGLNSGPVLLTDFSQHTHNMLLHPLLSGGILAGGLMAVIVLFNLLVSLRSPHPLIRSVTAFLLVSGLFEDTVLGTFPGPPTILWLVVTLYPAINWTLGPLVSPSLREGREGTSGEGSL